MRTSAGQWCLKGCATRKDELAPLQFSTFEVLPPTTAAAALSLRARA
jgi:hypothetical protein